MSIIIILIIIGIIVAGGFLTAFIWAVKSGQYEDTYSPSVRMLFDNTETIEEEPETTKNNSNTKSNNI